MRKYMMVLPCLLFSGLVAAEDVHRPSQRQSASLSVPTTADKPSKTSKARLADPSNRFHMTQNGKKIDRKSVV